MASKELYNNNIAAGLALLLALVGAVCLVLTVSSEERQLSLDMTSLESKRKVFMGRSDDDCCICLEGSSLKNKDFSFLDCGHQFHTSCINEWMRNHPRCPICRARHPLSELSEITAVIYSRDCLTLIIRCYNKLYLARINRYFNLRRMREDLTMRTNSLAQSLHNSQLFNSFPVVG